MEELSIGIQAFFRTEPHDDLCVALSGRMFPDAVPPKVPMPFSVISFPSDIPDYDLDRKATESVMVQFDLYSAGGSGAEGRAWALHKLFINKFDNCNFAVSGYQLTQCRRVMSRKITEDGNKRFIIQYKFKLGEL